MLDSIASRPSQDAPHLVVTLGPSTIGKGAALREAGATEFRLNAAHMSAAQVSALVRQVQREAPDTPSMLLREIRVGRTTSARV